jgi:sterol desaturase/sphingolipid hydroxylase (fatty acid hydroxylase superfamily)
MGRIFIGYKRWCEQRYLLNRMSHGDLVKAYFTYPAIQVYLLLAAALLALLTLAPDVDGYTLVAGAASVVVYPLAWYVLHRWVLHGSWLYKNRYTSAVWKRIHFDHHQDPNDLSVLFGALYTTLPTIVVITFPIGLAIAGLSGGLAAVAMGLIMTCVYEYCHCIQHLSYQPKNSVLQRMKRLHMAHHFHNETGNFGITNFLWDKLLGTIYERPGDVVRSATVRNLGYDDEQAARYPWVRRLSQARAEEKQDSARRGAAHVNA